MTARGMSRFGSRALAGELVGLLEAEQREDDPARRDRREDALGAVRVEAVGGGEVARVEVDDRQHEDRQQRDRRPSTRSPRCSCARACGSPRKLIDGEDRHQDDRRHDARGGQDARCRCWSSSSRSRTSSAGRSVIIASTSIGATVAACSHENQPNDAPARAAEGVVREARGAAGDGVHPAELGVRQREQEDRDRADHPRDDRRGAGRDERLLGAEQPARADDRARRRPRAGR